MENKRQYFIRGLRDLADLYEKNPDLPTPVTSDFNVFFWADDSTRERLSKIGRMLGTFDKLPNFAGNWYSLRKKFGEISIYFNFVKENVCIKRVVGTQKVKKRVYPTSIEPAEVEVEEEIVEWDCPNGLLRSDEEDIPLEPKADPDLLDQDEIPF